MWMDISNPPPRGKIRIKKVRRERRAERALATIDEWKVGVSREEVIHEKRELIWVFDELLSLRLRL